MARPIALGVLAALLTGVAWAVLSAVLGFHLGLLVVAAFAGWIIGTTVRTTGARRRILAAGLAAFTWLVGSVLDFALSQLVLPASTTPLGSRLTPAAYLDYASATFDIIQAASIAILVFVAWRSAR